MKVSTCCKAIALLLSYVFCAPLVASGVTIEVKEPGTLNQLIADVDDASFPELKITGKINAVDIIYLRAQEGRLAHVERLDLSDVTIVEGGGAYAVVKYKGGDVTMDNFVDTYYFSHEYKYESNYQSNMLGGRNYSTTIYSDDLSGMFCETKYPNVVIPNGLSRIGERAFASSSICTLESSLPLEVVGKNAFSGCKQLQTVDISAVKRIGSGAFSGCEKFIGTPDSTLVITSVDSLSSGTFGGCKAIRRVRLSPSLKYLDGFGGCSSLEECELPSAVTDVAAGAFSGCKSLKSVAFPAGIKRVGDAAFRGCASLKSVILPIGLEFIGKDAFQDCSSLKDVVIEGTPSGLSASTFGCTPFMDSLSPDDDNIVYLKNIAIREGGKYSSTPHIIKFKEGTVEMGDYFINDYRRKKYVIGLDIPSSVRRIGNNAFSSCALSNLNIPEGVEVLGDEAFAYCSVLTSVSLPESVVELGNKVFSGCKVLKCISLPSGIKKIGDYAFASCSSLEGEITIPEATEYLGQNIFDGCCLFRINYMAEKATGGRYLCNKAERLRVGPKVRCLPDNMTGYLKKVTFDERTNDAFLRIGSRCFYESTMGIALPKGKIEIDPSVFREINLTSFTCEGVVTRIEEEAFYRQSIRELVFNDGLEYIGKGAFGHCDSLKSVSLGRNVKYIGNGAFSGASKLVDIYLGEELDSIDSSAFSECDSLKKIVLPQTLRYIGPWAFGKCCNLNSVTLPAQLKEIGSRAFYYCSALSEIVVPDSVTSIEESTFEGCYNLNSVTLPAQLKEIGRNAFKGCQLKEITCYSAIPPSCDNYEFKTYGTPTLYVYESAMPLYKETYPWSQFKMEAMADGGSGPEQCATPIVSFADGRLHFTCDTEGAEVFYTLKCPDVISYETLLTSEDVPLEAYYEITCYAKAKGYLRSHVANAKLYWVRTADVENNINDVYMRGVTVQTEGNIITISGLNNNEEVSFYTIDGKYIGHSRAISGKAVFSSASTGTIVIIKIGDNSLKISI